MKETTALNQISRIVDKLSYKSAYIEIQTETDRFVLEKEKKNQIGFRKETQIMWSLFINILIGCMGILVIAFTLFVVIAMISVIKEKISRGDKYAIKSKKNRQITAEGKRV